jgi:hypothetical protein
VDRQGVTYASREDVKDALDILETSRAEAQIDRVLRAATDSVEGLLVRRFYPEIRTMTFDYPPWRAPLGTPWKLYLGQHELISVTTLTSGGTTFSASEYFLRPDDGPPFLRLELDISATNAFSAGSTHQRSISILGLYGYRNDESAAGSLATTVNSSTTTVDVSNGSLVGVGNLLRLETERMSVTGRSFLDSTENLGAAVAVDGESSITVSTGGFNAGEVLLIGAERMLITDVAGTTLVVKRAWDGTTLQAHANGADVYVSRRLTVRRGALGTTAAAHTAPVDVLRWTPPPLVQDLTIAEAMASLVQERTGYARTIGKGEGEREVRGVGLADLREQADIEYGRGRSRVRTV